MRLTLGAALPLLARYAVQGACQTDPRVIEKINEARERLMTKPQNWKGKTQRFRFCASRACITLPREIETVEAASVCSTPMKMRSQWYDILEGGPGPGAICGGDSVIDRGDGYVTFADLDTSRHIKVYADVPEASGARILLQGFDGNGNRVRTWDDTSSAWVDGEYVIVDNATPRVSTTLFSSLDGIQKEEGNGFVRIYAFTAGSAGVPASDITEAESYDQLVPNTGLIVWTGDLLAASWEGPEQSLDFLLQWYYEGGDLSANLYDLNGVVQNGFALASWSWVADEAPVVEQYAGSVIPDTAIGLNDPPFIPTATNLNWNAGQEHTFYLFFRGDGEGDGNGSLFLFDSSLTLVANETAVIAAAATWVYTPVGGVPFTTVTFSGNANMSLLFNEGENYGFKITQTDTGTLSIETLTDGIVPTPPDWNGSFQFSEVQAPDLLNGGHYTVRITRTYTDAVAPVADYLSLMSILHPDETLPSYRRYQIPALGSPCHGSASDDEEETTRQVIVQAKLRYLPVTQETDFLVIENLGALKQMLLAINEEEKGDLVKAEMHEAKAEKILADELRNHVGDAATSNQGMQIQQDCWAASTIPNIL